MYEDLISHTAVVKDSVFSWNIFNEINVAKLVADQGLI